MSFNSWELVFVNCSTNWQTFPWERKREIAMSISFLLLYNQLPQILQLKRIPICYLTVPWVRSPGRFKWVLPVIRVSQGWNQGVDWTGLLPEGFGKNPLTGLFSCWKNLVACSYRNEEPISFLAVSLDPHSAPKAHQHSLSYAFSIFKAHNSTSYPPCTLSL